jgi:hypothetical protein
MNYSGARAWNPTAYALHACNAKKVRAKNGRRIPLERFRSREREHGLR